MPLNLTLAIFASRKYGYFHALPIKWCSLDHIKYIELTHTLALIPDAIEKPIGVAMSVGVLFKQQIICTGWWARVDFGQIPTFEIRIYCVIVLLLDLNSLALFRQVLTWLLLCIWSNVSPSWFIPVLSQFFKLLTVIVGDLAHRPQSNSHLIDRLFKWCHLQVSCRRCAWRIRMLCINAGELFAM